MADIYQALGQQALHYTNTAVSALLSTLSSEETDSRLIPEIITTLAEIALALDREFGKYVDTVLKTVVTVKSKYNGTVDIRESIIDLYSGLIQGAQTNGSEKTGILAFSEEIINDLFLITSDKDVPDSLIGSSCGLLGDLALNYPRLFSDVELDQMDSLNNLLTKGKMSDCHKTKSVAFWASRQLLNACDLFGGISDEINGAKKARVSEEVYYSMKITVSNKQYITQNIETENVTIRLKPSTAMESESECNHVEATVRLPSTNRTENVVFSTQSSLSDKSDQEIAELRRLRKKRLPLVSHQEVMGKKAREEMDV